MQKSSVFTVITGASQGLGKALAIECAQQGRHLILVSLPGEGLPELANYLFARYRVEVLHYETDLTHYDAPQQLYDWVACQQLKVDTLINNAGIGGTLAFQQASPDYINNIILLNIRAVAMLTRLFVPELQQHPQAHILNISSMAAFSPIPFKTVYPASKAFVYSFSIGLREELRRTSIRVSVLHPGPMATSQDHIQRLQKHGTMARLSTLTTEQIARLAFRGMQRGTAIIVPGMLNKISYSLMRFVPHSVLTQILGRVFTRELPIYHVS